MAYENVEFSYNNFCRGPQGGTFCSINTTNVATTIQVKNSSGSLLHNYSVDPDLTQGISIRSIEYPGPRGAAGFFGDAPFFTLERNSSTQCTIRAWKFNSTNSTLEKDYDIVKSTSGSNYFNCYDMSVEYYHTEFDGATTTGTGKIKLDSISPVSVGTELLLGPSTDVTDLGKLELVEVTSISGSWAYIDSITSSGTTAPIYEYADTDDITYSKYIYLFSDIGQNNDSTKGSLYKLDVKDGSIIEVKNSGLYGGVRASAWSLDYDGIGIIKGNNLLYIDPNNNYYVTKSQTATNTEANDVTIIPVYDLIFDNNSIYRLQEKITLRDNNGAKATTTWTTYNYHQDTIVPYTLSIAPSIDPDGIVMNNGTITITVVVRDQFGVGLSTKTVDFSKTGDAGGAFDPISGQVVTNSSGVATIIYQTDYYDPTGTHTDTEDVVIKAKTDGGSSYLGVTGYTGWIWDEVEFLLWRKFTTSIENITQKLTLSGVWPTEGSDLYSQIYLEQLADIESDLYLKGLSKFQFPGGNWIHTGQPYDSTKIVTQLESFESDGSLIQLDEEFENVLPLIQEKQIENDLQVSQTHTSRHVLNHNKDTVQINQFKFIEDAIPPFWSEKNPVDTNIWIRLRPYGFSLDQSTLIFKVREVSYAGDTGYIDVTSLCTVSTFDAGGGLLGLDITYDPAQDFHHHATVFVTIEVYDQAPVPNIILTDYWFKIIPDYKAPYIENENPAREEGDVALNTNIEFDVFDAGVGVDITSLEFFVNNRIKTPTVSGISGGYHVSYSPTGDFFYGETVEITVKIKDASAYQNILYDMWRFYCIGSTGPWIDRSSIYPKTCSEGVDREQTNIYVNIYAIDDTGLDKESILVEIGGKERDVKITPIIYRLS